MYIRRSTKTLQDGERRTYVSFAHNVREHAKTRSSRSKPIIFANLGREEDLDADTVKGTRNALDRYL